VKRPTLPLPPWSGGPPDVGSLGPGVVLWLGPGGRDGWLGGLEAALAGRLWSPTLSTVSVPRASADPNPWLFRPDAHPPLRWGDPLDDVRSLDAVPDRPAEVGAVVFAAALAGLGGAEARVLLAQVAEVLPAEAPWLLLERNGAHAPEVVRNLLRDRDERGEGKATLRSGPELRRLLEVAGFGITEAWSLAGPGRRARVLAAAGTAAWLVLRGRRI